VSRDLFRKRGDSLSSASKKSWPSHARERLQCRQRDIVDGKPSELEYWNGAVVRLGREAQVPTPTHAHIYNCLLPQELHARGKIAFPE
jgi:hypothetical protein